MPQQQSVVQRNMRELGRRCNQIWKQRAAGMGGEELIVQGVQTRVQHLLNTREINLGVFYGRMVAVNQESHSGCQQKNGELPKG